MTKWKRIRLPAAARTPASQRSIFEVETDEETADEAATAGMEQAYRNSTTDYKRAARERLSYLIREYNKFTSDDIINHLNRIGIVGNHSALGAMIKGAERAGLITATGEYRESNRAERHKAPVRVWKSNIIKEDNEKTNQI